MKNIINIVVHPGFNLFKENSDLFYTTYLPQLDLGDNNVFLHCNILERIKLPILKTEFDLIKESFNSKDLLIDKIKRIENNEPDKSHFLNLDIVGTYLRKILFMHMYRKVKCKDRKKFKKFGPSFKRVTSTKKDNFIKLILSLSKKVPIFKNDRVDKNYLLFKEFLKERYPENGKNLHFDATILHMYSDILEKINSDLEENDVVYLFGENRNQCVNIVAVMLDKIGMKYEIKDELCSFKLNCLNTGNTFDKSKNYFLIKNKEL